MNAKTSVFIATTVDGFISRRDGSIDWLDRANRAVPASEDFGYAKFMASVDALVMGRNTFELACTFGEWPYGATPVVVLSHGNVRVPEPLSATVSSSRERPSALVARLFGEGARHLYIDGGRTIQTRMNARVGRSARARLPARAGDGGYRPSFAAGRCGCVIAGGRLTSDSVGIAVGGPPPRPERGVTLIRQTACR